MKKIALIFILAVFTPSLVLAWLAVRSLRDQQLILERQQFLLYQGVADGLAREADEFVADQLAQFGQQVENLLSGPDGQSLTTTFDQRLRHDWTCADIGFVVTPSGNITCPLPASSPAATVFLTDFGKFLGNREAAEVYVNNGKTANLGMNNAGLANIQTQTDPQADNLTRNNSLAQRQQISNYRVVVPQQALQGAQNFDAQQSKIASSEAEFRQLVGDSMDGAVARFVENRLKVLLWHRSPHEPGLIFGAELSLERLKQNLRPILDHVDPALRNDIAVALLDDSAKPVAVSDPAYATVWKRPFVATELDEELPHWEMAVYVMDPARLAQSARTLKLTLGWLTGVLLLAIGVGGWLIVADQKR